ncbi:cytochrome P450 [Armillaria luteobubalina]|uniref:Cytochrome P450 n=1 Tax=Armillaria luteobubalina TaxID=153913 RepID=A0AA39QCD4_9AGAR|nr:cytochrome P450 [Armillaria luteobubalina]
MSFLLLLVSVALSLPLIGNLWDVPVEYPWVIYARWSSTYGDVIYLDTPGNPTVVINSAEAAVDLLEKRSGNYSDRPGCIGGYFINTSNPVQMRVTLVLLQQLLKTPDDFARHVRYHTSSVIMEIVYGYNVDPNGDPFVEMVDQALEGARIIGNEGMFLVDYIPSLKYLPRTHLKLMKRKEAEEVKERPFKYASESLASDLAASSFVSENLTNMTEICISEKAAQLEIVRNTAGVAFTAGTDTTVAVLLSAILAFVLYPEVQAKAQAELDAVVGPTRLLNFDDRPQLPYINAILLEVLRWNPVVPMEGTTFLRARPSSVTLADIVPGCRAILHDEKHYPNPLVFDPERFMPEVGKELQPEPTAAFGFGRRVCSGRYLALNIIWITIASMAATLSFSEAVDSEGRVVKPSDTFTNAAISFPVPFKCAIKARSASAQTLIESDGL